jgi:hypothetical protein
MYVGHYKSVSQGKEFFSKKRNTLDFPTQVEFNQQRYLLFTTYAVPSNSIYKRLIDRANELNIDSDVEIDT